MCINQQTVGPSDNFAVFAFVDLRGDGFEEAEGGVELAETVQNVGEVADRFP